MTAILVFIIIALAAALCYILCKRPRIVEISREAPEGTSQRAGWMKLQALGKDFVKVKDGKVIIRMVKW